MNWPEEDAHFDGRPWIDTVVDLLVPRGVLPKVGVRPSVTSRAAVCVGW